MDICYDLSSDKTRKREVASLIECAEELHCDQLTIITRAEECEISSKDYHIRVRPFAQWVCEEG